MVNVQSFSLTSNFEILIWYKRFQDAQKQTNLISNMNICNISSLFKQENRRNTTLQYVLVNNKNLIAY